jgi:hypothetical protein
MLENTQILEAWSNQRETLLQAKAWYEGYLARKDTPPVENPYIEKARKLERNQLQ